MIKYEQDLSARVNGNNLQPLAGAEVRVTDKATGLPAALYQDDELTPIPQPLVTTNTGYFGFKAANGEYELRFSPGPNSSRFDGFTRDCELYDADDVPNPVSAVMSSLGAEDGAGKVGSVSDLPGAVPTTLAAQVNEDVSIFRFMTSEQIASVRARDLSVDVRDIINEALTVTAAAGRRLWMPDGLYACSDYIGMPTHTRWAFSANARIVLTANTTIGGFICNPFSPDLVAQNTTDIEIYDLGIDCNFMVGENAVTLVNGTMRLFNPKIYRTRHSPVTLGGRGCQFEGGLVDGVYVYNPYFEDCSIGINSQASPSGSERAINLNYFNVMMRNVDTPFNVDAQFADPDTNTLQNMSTYVSSAVLFNCGKIRWAGDTSGGLGGGIICGDRGSGLKIGTLRVVNEASYGQCGPLVHGVIFNVHVDDVQIDVPYMPALFDFGQLGFGSSASGAYPSTVFFRSISAKCNLDYIVKAGSSTGRIGKAMLGRVEIDDTISTLAAVADTNCSDATDAFLDLVVRNDGFKATTLRSLASIYAAGNSVGLCQPAGTSEGAWAPVDASGAGLALAIAGTPWHVRSGRVVTGTVRLDYPVTSDTSNAVIGGLPITAANFSSIAGSVVFGYKTVSSLACGYVFGGSSNIVLTDGSGIPLTNAALSGATILMAITYLV